MSMNEKTNHVGNNRNVSTVACIGAGLIGQGWATVFALKSQRVILQDVTTQGLNVALKKITSNLKCLVQNSLITQDECEQALSVLETTTDIETAVDAAEYVQESVPDEYTVKTEVFHRIEKYASKDAVLASSASGLLISEIQKNLRYPERSVLVHPCLPVYLMPCVEICGGDKTSSETVNRAAAFMASLGKQPIILNHEVPGLIINRLQSALLREAVDLVARGVASAEAVDKAFRLGVGLRSPIMGPFLRAHIAGQGINEFFSRYSTSYTYRLADMADWKAFPAEETAKVIKSVSEMTTVKDQSLEDLNERRDTFLAGMLNDTLLQQ